LITAETQSVRTATGLYFAGAKLHFWKEGILPMNMLIDKKQIVPEAGIVTPDVMLSRIASLAPLVAACASDIEQKQRLPAELVIALKSARVYSMLVPRRYGGLAFELPDSLRAVEELTKLDGSVGWNAMIGQIGSIGAFLTTPALCEQIFADGQDHILAGSGQPVGKAERVAGGWKVTGTWPFASGCLDAEWIMGNCVMMEGGSPIPEPDGAGPMIRACLMPAASWEIKDTWHTVGLKGTGSNHVALHGVVVPQDHFFKFPLGRSFAPDRIFSRVYDAALMLHGAVSVGIAEGAVKDLVSLAASGHTQQRMTSALGETERFREGLAKLDAEVRAARALLTTEAEKVWQDPERPKAETMDDLAELQGIAAWVAGACVRVAEGCFELAGSQAVYESSPLQRRLRDVRVAATHAAVHPRNYVAAGAATLARFGKAE
jgi:indole-3-acetate monooxygenase